VSFRESFNVFLVLSSSGFGSPTEVLSSTFVLDPVLLSKTFEVCWVEGFNKRFVKRVDFPVGVGSAGLLFKIVFESLVIFVVLSGWDTTFLSNLATFGFSVFSSICDSDVTGFKGEFKVVEAVSGFPDSVGTDFLSFNFFLFSLCTLFSPFM
jgi:hypothetical protein